MTETNLQPDSIETLSSDDTLPHLFVWRAPPNIAIFLIIIKNKRKKSSKDQVQSSN